MTDKSITDRERLALLICECCGDDPDNIGYVRGNDSRWKDYLGAADRILAALPEMGWVKSEPTPEPIYRQQAYLDWCAKNGVKP